MEVFIRPLGRTLRVAAGVNLLDALRNNDIPVSYSCLAEHCGTCRCKHSGPMPCVAGGTGLAPILSIIRRAIAQGMQNAIHLYFGVRSARDIYGGQWLAALERQHPQLKVHAVVTSGQVPGCRTGFVTEAIAQDWASLKGFRAYLYGAPPMVEATALLARQMGVMPEQIHADAFYTSGM